MGLYGCGMYTDLSMVVFSNLKKGFIQHRGLRVEPVGSKDFEPGSELERHS